MKMLAQKFIKDYPVYFPKFSSLFLFMIR